MAIMKPTRPGKNAVLLVGHGRRASDTPAALIDDWRAARTNLGPGDPGLIDLETRIRHWPRTPENDPYKQGLAALLEEMRAQMPAVRVEMAFNEFCAPSIPEAVAALIADGIEHISVVSTMVTPGGGHAERDIPQCLDTLRMAYPGHTFRYVWPLPLAPLARFLSDAVVASEADSEEENATRF